MRLVPALGTLLVAMAAAGPARADLHADAEALAESWRASGLFAERRVPSFLEAGRHRLLSLDPADVSNGAEGCTTVTVLATRSLDFSVFTGPADRRGQRSLGGVATIVRCGATREDLSRVSVAMRSPRGAIEVVVARGPGAAPPPETTLVERSVDAPKTPVDPGRPRGSEPLAVRAARVEGRVRDDGATSVHTMAQVASDEGTATLTLRLADGCHRIEVVGDLGAHGRVPDLDAELRDTASGAMLARDRSESADARVDVCVGEATRVLLSVSGAAIRGRLAILDARWTIPAGIPESLGARVRATFAAGHRRRRAPSVREAAFSSSFGAAGLTQVPVEVEPGACYLISVASVRGEARSLSVSTDIGGRPLRDDGGPARDGGTLSFCSGERDHQVIRVDARGQSLVWMLSTWKLEAHAP